VSGDTRFGDVLPEDEATDPARPAPEERITRLAKDAGPIGSAVCVLREIVSGDRGVVILPREASALLRELERGVSLPVPAPEERTTPDEQLETLALAIVRTVKQYAAYDERAVAAMVTSCVEQACEVVTERGVALLAVTPPVRRCGSCGGPLVSHTQWICRGCNLVAQEGGGVLIGPGGKGMATGANQEQAGGGSDAPLPRTIDASDASPAPSLSPAPGCAACSVREAAQLLHDENPKAFGMSALCAALAQPCGAPQPSEAAADREVQLALASERMTPESEGRWPSTPEGRRELFRAAFESGWDWSRIAQFGALGGGPQEERDHG